MAVSWTRWTEERARRAAGLGSSPRYAMLSNWSTAHLCVPHEGRECTRVKKKVRVQQEQLTEQPTCERHTCDALHASQINGLHTSRIYYEQAFE